MHPASFIKRLRCNPDVCPCRTLQRPVDVHGDDVVDDLDGHALHRPGDSDGAFAHDVAHVVVMWRMLMSPSASPPSSTSSAKAPPSSVRP